MLLHICNKSDFRHLYSTGSWVQIRGGLYAHDFALVTNVHKSDILHLLIVPRIERRACTANKRKRRSSSRPHPSLMTNNDLKMIYNTERQLDPRQQYTNIGRHTFHSSGLLALSVMGVHAVTSASPSASEITVFTEAGLDTPLITHRHLLQVSDPVLITKGHFTKSNGLVLSVSDDYAQIAVNSMEGLSWTSRTSIHLSHLSRVFHIGHSAHIVLGSHAGHEGAVVAMTEDFVTLANSQAEVCLFIASRSFIPSLTLKSLHRFKYERV